MSATNVARGHRLYMQLGKQSVAGTAVAATGYRLELKSFQLDPDQGSAEDPSLIDGILVARDIFQFGRTYKGQMSGALRYLSLMKLLNAICGDGSSPATPVVSAADGNGIVTFTFKHGFTLPFLTAEVFESYDGLTTVAQYVDLVITQLRITGDAVGSGEGGVYTWEAQIAAKLRNVGITAAALSIADEETATFLHAGTFVDGLGDSTADFEPKTFTLEITNPIDMARYQQGSATPNVFTRDGRQTIKLTLVIGWQKNTQIAALEAWSQAVPHVVLTGTKLIGAAGHRSFDFTIPHAKVVDVKRPQDKFGTLYQTVIYQARYDAASSTGITIVAKNEAASIAAG